jgi:polyisoprenyl-teichoic acid--peptidoglycan teichoic acid transferase
MVKVRFLREKSPILKKWYSGLIIEKRGEFIVTNQSRRYYKQKRNKRKRTLIKRLLLFLFLIFFVVGGYGAYLLYTTFKAANASYEELAREKSKYREKAVEIRKEPFSVLIMGIEDYASDGQGGRSDTLMLLTFNPKDETMKLLSIPRDTRVEIPGKTRKDKINHAFAFGGKEMAIETVEDFLEIPIDFYATINFKGFVDIIDILGGVTVDVPFDFSDYKNGDWNKKYYFKKGKMTLNGDKALTYARMRKKDPLGDIGRNERQKQILKAVIDKLNSPSSILKIDDITKEIGKNVETNFTVSELLALQQKYSDFDSSQIDTLNIEGEGKYINGISYFIPDEESLEQVKDELKQHLNPTLAENQRNQSNESTQNP